MQSFPNRRGWRALCGGLICGLTIWASTVTPSQAWYGAGHMAIAILAYREMKPQTRAAVDALLKEHPDYGEWQKEIPTDVTADQRGAYLFAIAATWPDRIKSSRDHSVTIKFFDNDARNTPDTPIPNNAKYPDLGMHKTWHYADIPISADGVTRTTETPNAITQIPICRDGIASSTKALSFRAYYLAWLEHLVGDIHQPLHATSRYSATYPKGDAGGNGVHLQKDAAGATNLHGYWDGLLGDKGGDGPGGYSFPTDWKSIEATVTDVIADEPKTLAGFDPATKDDLKAEDWARESFDIDQDFVYSFGVEAPGPLPQPDAAYHTTAVHLAHQRAALAGHRLALMLDAALAQ